MVWNSYNSAHKQIFLILNGLIDASSDSPQSMLNFQSLRTKSRRKTPDKPHGGEFKNQKLKIFFTRFNKN